MRAVTAQKGFNELAPGQSKLPMPLLVAAILANYLAATMGWQAGAAVMMLFVLHLRHSDVADMVKESLVPPSPGRRTRKLWSVVLRPREAGGASK
eukprot:10478071-Heterocapsa_arctica.AAC.1